jgi:hypothetical protein
MRGQLAGRAQPELEGAGDPVAETVKVGADVTPEFDDCEQQEED